MKSGPIPENIFEWAGLKANLIPVPLIHTQVNFMLSRSILEAYQLKIFEFLKDEPLTLDEITIKAELNKRALKSLLNVLISSGYLDYKNKKYRLTRFSRKWCLNESPDSLYNQQMFNRFCWQWMDYLPDFLKTGKGLQYHEELSEKEWELYQKGMENTAVYTSRLAVKMAPSMKGKAEMLDIGGSHGLYSLEFCNRYPGLSSTILDLPGAVEKAEPILRQHYKGDKIRYQAGNALTDDFGENKYDLVLVSNLMHHFSSEQNRELSSKIARVLKKDGYFIIHEFLRPETSGKMEMIGSILDLYFNLSSTSGNWTKEELTGFQEAAGLKTVRVRKFLVATGYIQITARKV